MIRTRYYEDDGTFLAHGTPRELAEQVKALREACHECLLVADEAYRATGYMRIAKSSIQRMKIEAAIKASDGSQP